LVVAPQKNFPHEKKAHMALVIENIIMWVPWGLGMADAGLTAYYTNNFKLADVDVVRGTLAGESGTALLGVGSANIAVQIWAIFEWFKHLAKFRESKNTMTNRHEKYEKAMMVFWGMMMLFYIVAIVSSALDIHMVTNFADEAITISGDKLGGTFGDAVEGLSYTTLAVGGVAFFTYLYTELFTLKGSPHPGFVEVHGGDY
jgi:hypothetical protein